MRERKREIEKESRRMKDGMTGMKRECKKGRIGQIEKWRRREMEKKREIGTEREREREKAEVSEIVILDRQTDRWTGEQAER